MVLDLYPKYIEKNICKIFKDFLGNFLNKSNKNEKLIDFVQIFEKKGLKFDNNNLYDILQIFIDAKNSAFHFENFKNYLKSLKIDFDINVFNLQIEYYCQ